MKRNQNTKRKKMVKGREREKGTETYKYKNCEEKY